MGWTYCSMPSDTTAREFLREQYTQTFVDGLCDGCSVISDALTHEAYFAVIERHDKTLRTLAYHCVIALIDHGHGRFNFGWKSMTESIGPYVIPPLEFFTFVEALIPEPPKPFGANWRQRCRQHHAITAPQHTEAQQ